MYIRISEDSGQQSISAGKGWDLDPGRAQSGALGLASNGTASKTISLAPQPDHFYRIHKNDTLLKIAGIAYTKEPGTIRLRRAQLINRHPFNWRYHTPGKQRFTKENFPEGIVSFSPSFSCNNTDFNFPQTFPSKGSCYPLLFIPPEKDIWMVPPTEVIQPDISKCWAAAILSWSRVTPSTKRFTSLNDVIEKFRKLEVSIPSSSGVIKRAIVNNSGALIRWPKTEVIFTGEKTVVVPPGQLTLEKVAVELRLSLVVKDSTLTLTDIIDALKNSQGPIIALKFSKGNIGHGTVVFGASETDGFIGEMDPFPLQRPTGPAFGALGTRWLPMLNAFKLNSQNSPWEEFAFLFKKIR
jgi:hypothetical protein